eukprot:Skav217502  [mRNA]  locus=scaffold1908:285366:289824:+ [translate_table: standard]
MKTALQTLTTSTLDELHGADRAQEEHGGHHERMDCQPSEGEDGIGHRSPGHCRGSTPLLGLACHTTLARHGANGGGSIAHAGTEGQREPSH